MRSKVENIFEGRWGVVSLEVCAEGGVWVPEYQFEEGEYWLEFSSAELIDGNTISRYEGVLRRCSRQGSGVETIYCYDVDDDGSVLIVDRSHYLEDGFLDICEESWFSVEELERDVDSGKRSILLSLISEPDCLPTYYRLLLVGK